MNPPLPSSPTRSSIGGRKEVAAALRALADRVERGDGYYEEVTLTAYEQPSGLPFRQMHSPRYQQMVYRMPNTKYIGFTLLLRESSAAWLAEMLQQQWVDVLPPAPEKQPEPPFTLSPSL